MEDLSKLSNTGHFGSIGKSISSPNIMHHHSASLDNLLLEEQPAWLDELLSEPASPKMNKGHRRSASDTSAYLNSAFMPFTEDGPMISHFAGPSWLDHSINRHDDMWQRNPYEKPGQLGWEMSTANGTNLHTHVSWGAVNRVGTTTSKSAEKQVNKMKEGVPTKPDGPGSKTDSKRIKQ